MTLRPHAGQPAPGRSLFFLTLAVSAGAFFGALLAVDPLDSRSDLQLLATTNPLGAFHDDDGDVPHDIRFDKHVESALDWLVRHQFEDGSWGARSFNLRCAHTLCLGRGSDDLDAGVTALAALALIESPLLDRPAFRRAARKALTWLMKSSDREGGRFGAPVGKYMYAQALATLALARGYEAGVDPDDVRLYPGYVRRGADFLERAKNPGAVWRYDVQTGHNDTSVTGWVVEALLASRGGGATIDETRLSRDVLAWLDSVTLGDGTVGYSRRGVGSAVQPGVNDRYAQNETLAAVSVALRLGAGQSAAAPDIRSAVSRVAVNLPWWSNDGASVDFNYWYQGTTSLSRVRDAYPRAWQKWSSSVARTLAGRQRNFRDECLEGSWDPTDKWGGDGGRIYATAINALTLVRVWKTIPATEER